MAAPASHPTGNGGGNGTPASHHGPKKMNAFVPLHDTPETIANNVSLLLSRAIELGQEATRRQQDVDVRRERLMTRDVYLKDMGRIVRERQEQHAKEAVLPISAEFRSNREMIETMLHPGGVGMAVGTHAPPTSPRSKAGPPHDAPAAHALRGTMLPAAVSAAIAESNMRVADHDAFSFAVDTALGSRFVSKAAQPSRAMMTSFAADDDDTADRGNNGGSPGLEKSYRSGKIRRQVTDEETGVSSSALMSATSAANIVLCADDDDDDSGGGGGPRALDQDDDESGSGLGSSEASLLVPFSLAKKTRKNAGRKSVTDIQHPGEAGDGSTAKKWRRGSRRMSVLVAAPVPKETMAHELAHLFNLFDANGMFLVSTDVLVPESMTMEPAPTADNPNAVAIVRKPAEFANNLVTLSPTNAFRLQMHKVTPADQTHATYTSRKWTILQSLLTAIVSGKVDLTYFAEVQRLLETTATELARHRHLLLCKDEDLTRERTRVAALEHSMTRLIQRSCLRQAQLVDLATHLKSAVELQREATSAAAAESSENRDSLRGAGDRSGAGLYLADFILADSGDGAAAATALNEWAQKPDDLTFTTYDQLKEALDAVSNGYGVMAAQRQQQQQQELATEFGIMTGSVVGRGGQVGGGPISSLLSPAAVGRSAPVGASSSSAVGAGHPESMLQASMAAFPAQQLSSDSSGARSGRDDLRASFVAPSSSSLLLSPGNPLGASRSAGALPSGTSSSLTWSAPPTSAVVPAHLQASLALAAAHTDLLTALRRKGERARRRRGFERRMELMEGHAMEGEDCLSVVGTVFRLGESAYARLRDVLYHLPSDLLGEIFSSGSVVHHTPFVDPTAHAALVLCPCCRFDFDPSKPADHYRKAIVERTKRARQAMSTTASPTAPAGPAAGKAIALGFKPVVPGGGGQGVKLLGAPGGGKVGSKGPKGGAGGGSHPEGGADSSQMEFAVMSLQQMLDDATMKQDKLEKDNSDLSAEVQMTKYALETEAERAEEVRRDMTAKLEVSEQKQQQLVESVEAAAQQVKAIEKERAVAEVKLINLKTAAAAAFDALEAVQIAEREVQRQLDRPGALLSEDGTASGTEDFEKIAKAYARKYYAAVKTLERHGLSEADLVTVEAVACGQDAPIPVFEDFSVLAKPDPGVSVATQTIDKRGLPVHCHVQTIPPVREHRETLTEGVQMVMNRSPHHPINPAPKTMHSVMLRSDIYNELLHASNFNDEMKSFILNLQKKDEEDQAKHKEEVTTLKQAHERQLALGHAKIRSLEELHTGAKKEKEGLKSKVRQLLEHLRDRTDPSEEIFGEFGWTARPEELQPLLGPRDLSDELERIQNRNRGIAPPTQPNNSIPDPPPLHSVVSMLAELRQGDSHHVHVPAAPAAPLTPEDARVQTILTEARVTWERDRRAADERAIDLLRRYQTEEGNWKRKQATYDSVVSQLKEQVHVLQSSQTDLERQLAAVSSTAKAAKLKSTTGVSMSCGDDDEPAPDMVDSAVEGDVLLPFDQVYRPAGVGRVVIRRVHAQTTGELEAEENRVRNQITELYFSFCIPIPMLADLVANSRQQLVRVVADEPEKRGRVRERRVLQAVSPAQVLLGGDLGVTHETPTWFEDAAASMRKQRQRHAIDNAAAERDTSGPRAAGESDGEEKRAIPLQLFPNLAVGTASPRFAGGRVAGEVMRSESPRRLKRRNELEDGSLAFSMSASRGAFIPGFLTHAADEAGGSHTLDDGEDLFTFPKLQRGATHLLGDPSTREAEGEAARVEKESQRHRREEHVTPVSHGRVKSDRALAGAVSLGARGHGRLRTLEDVVAPFEGGSFEDKLMVALEASITRHGTTSPKKTTGASPPLGSPQRQSRAAPPTTLDGGQDEEAAGALLARLTGTILRQGRRTSRTDVRTVPSPSVHPHHPFPTKQQHPESAQIAQRQAQLASRASSAMEINNASQLLRSPIFLQRAVKNISDITAVAAKGHDSSSNSRRGTLWCITLEGSTPPSAAFPGELLVKHGIVVPTQQLAVAAGAGGASSSAGGPQSLRHHHPAARHGRALVPIPAPAAAVSKPPSAVSTVIAATGGSYPAPNFLAPL